jgi:hypothetical protein
VEKSKIQDDVKCQYCSKEFIELLKEADIDSEGNEFHSCNSKEEIIGSSLVDEEAKIGEEEWSDESDERPKKKKKSRGPKHHHPHPPRA